MEKIIERLLRIEAEAADMMRQAEDEQAQLPRVIEADRAQIAEQTEGHTRRFVLSLRGEARKEWEAVREAAAAQHARQAQALTADFDAHRAQWAAAIFRKVIDYDV